MVTVETPILERVNNQHKQGSTSPHYTTYIRHPVGCCCKDLRGARDNGLHEQVGTQNNSANHSLKHFARVQRPSLYQHFEQFWDIPCATMHGTAKDGRPAESTRHCWIIFFAVDRWVFKKLRSE